jgi:elongation factor P
MISIFSKRAFQLPVNQIKKGDVISFRGKMYYINHYMQHSQGNSLKDHPIGRGGSHYKVELKDVISGSKANERFNAGTMLEGVVLQERKVQDYNFYELVQFHVCR